MRNDGRTMSELLISYPPELPVSARRDEIVAAIRDSQVVVIAGETGSGKTTQLPKMCLDAGRGVDRQIGHTQPRRIAARAVAERVAAELGTELGDVVGYQVRFTDRSSERTRVKVMTDGILLAEIQHDRDLRRYDTLILDEAHERSLNVDFLIGYLAQLLPRRPDLHVVITSATIDTARFAAHFGDAPVIEVTGRTYPVEVRYRPPADDVDQVSAITNAVQELAAEGPGDVLVFLSGEREIRDTADALTGLDLPQTEVLPLFARLSAAEQHRVFQPHPGRRVVLATNVAETSLTVPGIRFVVDPGTARISRYSHRTKVQRLPIEKVSRASADQRAGRCGRVEAGICVRLYDEDDYRARPEFTDPEILRTNLASVILQMVALDLGDVASFPFLDPPDRRLVRAGLELLTELGAVETVEGRLRLTGIGQQLARLPVDPRIGRMLVAAGEQGCVREMLVIAAALSIQDPRERPAEAQAAADELHARFRDPGSDFVAYLNLWSYLHDQQRALSGNAFRRLCRSEFLHYLRVREWQDLHAQLRQAARSLGLVPAAVDSHPDAVHRALLAGLLTHIGMRDEEKREYLGTRGSRFTIWPGSVVARKQPRWVMAAELVETSRLFGRTVARIDPEWVEPLAPHLVVRSISEPHWSAEAGAALAYERVTLLGLPVVARRRVQYARIDPVHARKLFLRHALVEGDWHTPLRFVRENRRALAEPTEAEHRTRRRDAMVDEDELYDFYDRLLPGSVVSGRTLESWWRSEKRRRPGLLTMRRPAPDYDRDDYPDTWPHPELDLPLVYRFAPGEPDDGVTVRVPLPVLNRLRPASFTWQVPGYRVELVTALLRTLPKQVRTRFVPAPDVARAAVAELPCTGEGALYPALQHVLQRLSGAPVPPGEWRPDALPDHLRVRFAVVDPESGDVVAAGRDLGVLQRELAPYVQTAVAAVAADVERTGLTAWPGGELPRTVARGAVEGFPALVDEGTTVGVRVLATPLDQARAMWRGTRRLLLLSCGSPVKAVVARLAPAEKLALGGYPHAPVPELLDDCVAAAVDDLVREAGGPVWDDAAWTALRDAVRADLHDATLRVTRDVAATLRLLSAVDTRLAELADVDAVADALADARAQLAGLLPAGFVVAHGARRVRELPRYLTALERRLGALPGDAARDRSRLATVQRVTREWESAGRPVAARWLIEELRVSLWAQQLGTAVPVSEARILATLA
jgi:ATP-dependent helicase HrpA